MKLLLLSLLILHKVLEELACSPNPTNEQAAIVWDYYVKNHYRGKIGFTQGYDNIPMEKKVEYGKWLVKYVKNKREQKENIVNGPAWSDFGGDEGQLPPPWAYIKGGYARPDYCVQRFNYGKCPPKYQQNLILLRYGYNSWSEKCESFNYSGCGGNQNRFIRKYECERTCRSPRTCCDGDDQEYPYLQQ